MHFSDWVSILGLFGTIIAVGTLLGVALRVGKNTQTVNNYRESAQAWEAKAKVQENTIEDQKSQITTLQHEVGELRGKIAVLSDLVTGKEVLETLAREIMGAVEGIRSNVLDRETFENWQSEIRTDFKKLLEGTGSNVE
jgi:predicted RNase H-like nuclease (RuvC/YqgF family)